MVEKVKVLNWDNVENYDELLSLNLNFINGLLRATPYHGGPLVDPSKELIVGLDQLHRYGLLTVNGQEAMSKRVECTDTATFLLGKNLEQGSWYEIEQCGYLEFHIDIDSFVDNKNNNVVTEFIDKIKGSNLIYRILDMRTSKVETNMRGYFSLGHHRLNKKEIKLNSTKWTNNIGIHEHAEPRYCYWNTFNKKDYFSYAPNRLLKKTINIILTIPEYGIGNLEEIIINMCKKIDLKMHNFIF